MSSQQAARGGRGGRGGRRGRGGGGGGANGGGTGGGRRGRGESPNPNNRGGGSTGGSQGRGRGGRRPQNRTNSAGSNPQPQSNGGPTSLSAPGADFRDEEVLIAFMPYLKADDPRAIAIHEEYQTTNDSKTFLKATREFLANAAAGSTQPSPAPAESTSSPVPYSEEPVAIPSARGMQPTASTSSTASGSFSAAPAPIQTSNTPVQSPIRPPMGLQQQRPLTTTPTSHMSGASNQSPSSYSMNHPMSLPPNSPTILNQGNPPNFYLPPTLQHPNMQNMQPAAPPSTPQSHGSRPPIGFPLSQQQQGMQHMQQSQNMLHQQQQHMHYQQQQQQQQQYHHLQQQQQQQQQQQLENQNSDLHGSLSMMESLEQQLDRLMGGDDDMPVSLSAPSTPAQSTIGAIGTPRDNNGQQEDAATSFLANIMSQPSPGGFPNTFPSAPIQPRQQATRQPPLSPADLMSRGPGSMMMTSPVGSRIIPPPQSPALSDVTSGAQPQSQSHSPLSLTPAQMSPVHQSMPTPVSSQSQPLVPAKTPRKEVIQQKRLWTHLEEQPGRVTVNDMNVSSPHVVLDVRPRQELSARWMLSWKYLQQRAEEIARRKFESAMSDDENEGGLQPPRLHPRDDNPLNRLLPDLRLGLFRRGCAENGSQASIISKSVMASGGGRPPYLDAQNQMVIGTVPFYSPRTPGHVVFRLYWEDEPIYTLGVGPTLHVRVTEDDYESTIRFLLSNMKKKVNPTSLSSLHSLALVLETPLQPPQQNPRARHQQHQQQQSNDRAGRATWGCICEARKVLDACAAEYAKTNQRLAKLAAAVEEMKAEIEDESKEKEGDGEEEQSAFGNDVNGIDGKFDDASQDASGIDWKSVEQQERDEERAQILREKTRALMSGRASCERKWRDSQLAFASILKAVVSNPSMPLLLRQDMIQKMRLEYELWCPLCEEFSVPGGDEAGAVDAAAEATANDNDEEAPTIAMWYEPLKSFPAMLTTDHVRICQESRSSMQLKTLSFVPNTRSLQDILFVKNAQAGKTPTMDPKAVAVLNQLSGAMGKMFQEVFTPEIEQRVHRQREVIRAQLEALVQQCDAFPSGTKVAIFGSSANGFGTPQSDLDMCLQIPSGCSLVDDENDPSGSVAMAKLAENMELQAAAGAAAGGIVLKDVDTARLTARIPIIMFRCPILKEDGTEDVIECDLSMHNPLAVMNTTFLRTYANINPVTRVLAYVIKRWTKARDINNPARHTLSSYGYIIMLLHYLTYHQRAGNGLMAPVAGPEGRPLRQGNQAKPLLPNLLWMDTNWPQEKAGTPYRELQSRPKHMVQHPLEKINVNAHFYRPRSQAELQALLRLFPGQDLSLAILLTSFFRYYAYEFDYKRFVVSLHSTASRGLVEREVKAELDGWRHYSAALTIEDPFETFYDVAHVLRGGYYHRIRREFAVAYSKIADVVSGNENSSWVDVNGEKIDPSAMSGEELIDWICEPVAATATVANGAVGVEQPLQGP